jgi:hypothetical protein
MKKPSARQIQYLDNLAAGTTKRDAALEAGYSAEVADNPAVIEKTATFKQLLVKNFPDGLLNKVGKEGLKATKLVGKHDTEVPDFFARHKYWETVLKMRGFLQPEDEHKQFNQFNTVVNIMPETENAS